MNVENPSISAVQRTVGFFVYPAFQILDLTGPLSAFHQAGVLAGTPLYRLPVLSTCGGSVASSAGVEIATSASAGAALDTLIVAGGRVTQSFVAADVESVRTLAPMARRVASVCTGAFLLAAAGLLDGRMASTHWRWAASLQRAFPNVRVDGDRIFVRDGSLWTSAGVTAGIDLALALIEDDHGSDLAKAVARELVVHHRRAGGQSQYSEMLALEPATDRIRRALVFAQSNLDARLDVERLAAVACLGPRQFSRAFRAETGETPAKAVERLRTEAASARIEGGTEPVEVIATALGFGDPERMRRAFVRHFGHPPQAVRRLARARFDAVTAGPRAARV